MSVSGQTVEYGMDSTSRWSAIWHFRGSMAGDEGEEQMKTRKGDENEAGSKEKDHHNKWAHPWWRGVDKTIGSVVF